jgi:hypothetical protein
VPALADEYTNGERYLMRILIDAGIKFSVAWRKFLEPALLNHTKAGVACKFLTSSYSPGILTIRVVTYYQVKKADYMSVGKVTPALLKEAFQMSLGTRQVNLDTPIVEIPPKPKRPRYYFSGEDGDSDADERPHKR